MLVLGRRAGEAIDIGGGIKVKVVAIQGNRVRIGIDAPADVRITREELQQWQDLSFGETLPLQTNAKSGCEFAMA